MTFPPHCIGVFQKSLSPVIRRATEEVYWLHDRVKNHSFLHGKDVAIKYWTHVKLKALTAGSTKQKRIGERDVCFISIDLDPDDQKSRMVEWFDCPVDSTNPWACVS